MLLSLVLDACYDDDWDHVVDENDDDNDRDDDDDDDDDNDEDDDDDDNDDDDDDADIPPWNLVVGSTTRQSNVI